MNEIEESNSRFMVERSTAILEQIKKYGSQQVKSLALMFNVSEATIRRDLIELEAMGLIKRVHGGAILKNISTTFEYMYHDKVAMRMDEKKRIAEQAVEEIKDGDAIFLDSGTTTYQIALQLESKRNLTIITYDMSIASTLKIHPTSQVIVTGGIVRKGYNVLIGTMTETFIRNMRVDKVFLSADAIDDKFGISNANYLEAGIKELLVESGKRVIVVADHTKFGKVAVAKVCNLNQIELIITDKNLSQQLLTQIIKCGVNIKCV